VQLDTALPWLALRLTRGIAARLRRGCRSNSARPKMSSAQRCGNWKYANCLPRPRRPSSRKRRALPTPVRAALTKLERPEGGQRNLLVAQSLTGSGQKIYALLSSDEPGRLTTSWRPPA